MKLIIASDIHGSEYYMKQLKERFEAEEAEQLILLGDIYYHGPRNPLPKDYNPQGVANILNSMYEKVICIRGNCDSEVDEMISKFKFTESMQLYVNNKKILLTHGHKLNADELDNFYDIVIYGHLHTGFITKTGKITMINTGSISLPKNNSVNSYVLLSENGVQLKAVSGNLLEREDFINEEV